MLSDRSMSACATRQCQCLRCPEAPEWPIGELVPVRESLALSTLFFFKFAPRHASHLFGMWDQVSNSSIFFLRSRAWPA